jgi:GAF domain-containing protein
MNQSRHDRIPQLEPLGLAEAFSELQNLVLDGPDVSDFLHQLAALAAAVVPGTHCGVTLRRDQQVATVASNDAVAMMMDEIQYLRGHGPCLEAMHTGTRIDVPDMVEETRWGDYSAHAMVCGIRSAVALPLIVNDKTIGALNLFSPASDAFAEADVQRALAFTRQAATALTILLRQADNRVLDDQLREALSTRAVIDQALGMLMVTRKINSTTAFDALRHASQTSNRKVSEIAAELIHTMSGHSPEPPRALTQRARLTLSRLHEGFGGQVDRDNSASRYPRAASSATRAATDTT